MGGNFLGENFSGGEGGGRGEGEGGEYLLGGV